MRPIRTASFLATGTRARLGPTYFTSFRPQLRKAKRFLTVVNSKMPRRRIALLGYAHAEIGVGRLVASVKPR
jgi:hypothetical protein